MDQAGFEHAEDETLIRYFEILERATGARALDIVVMRGSQCVHCGGGPATELSKDGCASPDQGRANDWKVVCASCRRPWEGREIPVFKGEVDVGREVGRTEQWLVDLVDEWRHVRFLIEPVPAAWGFSAHAGLRWRRHLAAWRALLHPKLGTPNSAAYALSVLDSEGHWTPATVRGRVTFARNTVSTRRRVVRSVAA